MPVEYYGKANRGCYDSRQLSSRWAMRNIHVAESLAVSHVYSGMLPRTIAPCSIGGPASNRGDFRCWQDVKREWSDLHIANAQIVERDAPMQNDEILVLLIEDNGDLRCR